MAGSMCKLGTFIWRATSGSTARKDLFVCPTEMEYIDGRFEQLAWLAIGSKWRSGQTRER